MKLRIITGFIALLYASIIPTAAQTLDSAKVDSVKTDTMQKARGNWYWAHGSLGAGTRLDRAGIMLNADIGASVAVSHHLFTAFGHLALTGLVNGFLSAGGMYGYIARNDWTFSSASAGLAWVGDGRENTVGLLLEGQIAAKVPVIGAGLKVRANINSLHPYLGLSAVVHLGWMP